MDIAVAREILRSTALKSVFQAVLLTARTQGHTVAELATQLGVSERTLYRWISRAKGAKHRDPHAELIDRAAAATGECQHAEAFFFGRKRICLVCLASNFERDLTAQRKAAEREKRFTGQPAAKFKPKGVKSA
jgi:transposase-like protein